MIESHPALAPRFVLAASLALTTPAFALTGVQIGPSGKTYASADLQCALHPTLGFAPMVMAGLYNPKRSTQATVSLNGAPVATVGFTRPDATVWLANGANQVGVALNRKTVDRYDFDASAPGLPNLCIPDTSGNSVAGDLEVAASGKSSATVTPGCAWNASTGRAQPYVNLFDNGGVVLNVSVNDVPLTQLSSSRPHTPVFLAAGLNVIATAHAALSVDAYVRDGGTGSCQLP